MGEDDYFTNIYLTLMTHMKARGLPMPPILSKREDVRALMQEGKVSQLEDLLRGFLVLEGAFLDERCQAHINYEAAEILKTAQWEKDKKDPTIPLEKTFPDLRITPLVGAEQRTHGKYNILAVENDLNDYGGFSQLVIRALIKDGRWNGSNIITEVNLPMCMQLCGTGKIDVILFDWRNPSVGEMLMIQPEEVNPFFTLYHENTQAAIDLTDGLNFTLPDGRTLSYEEMEEEGSQLNIRHAWMDKITTYCREKEVTEPAFYIVRDHQDQQDLSMIVAQKLNKPI